MEEKIYEVYWSGPYSLNKAKNLKPKKANKFVLYKIYQTHPLYGPDSLVYIGKTERGGDTRINEHSDWLDYDKYGKPKIYFASIGEFTDWESTPDKHFEPIDSSIIGDVEALLIYAHQPAYNTMNKKTAGRSRGIRVFNTGEYGALQDEVSALFHWI